MFKENIMKKIAGLSVAAFILMPSVVNAGTQHATITYLEDSSNPGVYDTCKPTTVEEFKNCVEGKGDFKDVTKVNPTTSLTIKETYNYKNGLTMDFTAYDLTLDTGVTMKLVDASIKATKVTIRNNATLDVTSYDNKAIATSKRIAVKAGTLKVDADNTKGNLRLDKNTALAIEAPNIEVDGGIVTIVNGKISKDNSEKINILVEGKSTLSLKDVNGNITVDKSQDTTRNLTTAGTITATEVTGTVALVNKSTLTADKVNTVTANDESTANVKTITDGATVNGAKASIEFVGKNVNPIVTKGIVRQASVISPGVTEVKVYTKGIKNVDLRANEILVVKAATDLEKDFIVKGPNGAKIDNQTGSDLSIYVNNTDAKVVIESDKKGDDAYVIANGTNASEEQPGNTTQTPDGDTTIGKNPATGDSIMSYVTLALTSVASLGLAVKKFLF